MIRTVDAIDSSKQKAGFRFTATLETNLQAEDQVIAPRGTTVYGRLAQASSAGRMSGSSELTLELTDILINGSAYPLLTSTYELKGKGEGGKTAKKVVGGAGLGALVVALLEAEKVPESALLRAPPPEPLLLPLRKDSNSRSRASLYWNFVSSNQ